MSDGYTEDHDDATDVFEPVDRDGGLLDGLTTAIFGPKHMQNMEAATERARHRIERIAEVEATDAAERSRHTAQLHDQELRQARARVFQAQVISALILAIGVEVLVFMPLLVWGLWTGELFG